MLEDRLRCGGSGVKGQSSQGGVELTKVEAQVVQVEVGTEEEEEGLKMVVERAAAEAADACGARGGWESAIFGGAR